MTPDPKATWDQVKRALPKKALGIARAASRNVRGSKYTILWPPGLETFDVQ